MIRVPYLAILGSVLFFSLAGTVASAQDDPFVGDWVIINGPSKSSIGKTVSISKDGGQYVYYEPVTNLRVSMTRHGDRLKAGWWPSAAEIGKLLNWGPPYASPNVLQQFEGKLGPLRYELKLSGDKGKLLHEEDIFDVGWDTRTEVINYARFSSTWTATWQRKSDYERDRRLKREKERAEHIREGRKVKRNARVSQLQDLMTSVGQINVPAPGEMDSMADGVKPDSKPLIKRAVDRFGPKVKELALEAKEDAKELAIGINPPGALGKIIKISTNVLTKTVSVFESLIEDLKENRDLMTDKSVEKYNPNTAKSAKSVFQ